MIKFRQKFFSIQEGGYKGGRRGLNKASYPKRIGIGSLVGGSLGAALGANNLQAATKLKGGLIGAGIGIAAGAGVGALTAWMHDKCDQSSFNTGLSTGANSYTLISALEDSYDKPNSEETNTSISSTEVDPKTGYSVSVSRKVTRDNTGVVARGTIYTVNEDPNKCTISAYYSANVLVLYINKPTNHELSFINKVLDEYCFKFRNADYISTQLRNNVFEVEVSVVEGTETWLCHELVEAGFCLNIMTGNKF